MKNEDNHRDSENIDRQKIEKYLAVKQKASINQIAQETKLSWATVKKHLDYLQTIGRVHGERLGNSIIYFFNGVGEWTKKVELNQKHILWLDTFVSYFGEPFIRIKEVKRKESKWETFGEIMITKNKLREVINFLSDVEKNIGKYGGL